MFSNYYFHREVFKRCLKALETLRYVCKKTSVPHPPPPPTPAAFPNKNPSGNNLANLHDHKYIIYLTS